MWLTMEKLELKFRLSFTKFLRNLIKISTCEKVWLQTTVKKGKIFNISLNTAYFYRTSTLCKSRDFLVFGFAKTTTYWKNSFVIFWKRSNIKNKLTRYLRLRFNSKSTYNYYHPQQLHEYLWHNTYFNSSYNFVTIN